MKKNNEYIKKQKKDKRRTSNKFREYFDMIWNELNEEK